MGFEGQKFESKRKESEPMITLSNFGKNSADLLSLVAVFLDILLDKGVLSENELLGYCLKAGVKINIGKEEEPKTVQ